MSVADGDISRGTRLHFKSEGCLAQAPIRSEMRNQPESATARVIRDFENERCQRHHAQARQPDGLLKAVTLDLLNSHS